MARGFSAGEVRVTAGPVAGLISNAVALKIMEQKEKFGPRYETRANKRIGWPSALTREIELRRALSIDPDAKFADERNDPQAPFNQAKVEKMIIDMPVEMGVLYDKYNRLISITKGSKDTVSADALRTQFKGGTFIHNHPDGGPFSAGDLHAYLHYEPEEVIALASEGKYSLKGSPDGASGFGPRENLAPKLHDLQVEEFAKVAPFALNSISKELDAKTIKTITKAKTWDEIEKKLPGDQRQKFLAITNKHIGEATQKMLAKMGFEVKFTPAKKPPGYPSYDKIPTM